VKVVCATAQTGTTNRARAISALPRIGETNVGIMGSPDFVFGFPGHLSVTPQGTIVGVSWKCGL
jgi:hypothetical protein